MAGIAPSRFGFAPVPREATPFHVAYAPSAPETYAPYAVDWRFLPEEALIVKDTLRHHLVIASNFAARSSISSKLWIQTFGFGPLRAVTLARRLFIHIPKTGGTSICKLIYSKNLPHYTAQFWSDVYGPAIEGVPSFSVIRHPAERLVSAYKMIRAGGTEIMAYSRYWRRRLRPTESFEAFLDYLTANISKPGVLPSDLAPQSDFILDREHRVMVDYLFGFDRMNGLPRSLAQWLDVPAIPHLNATPPTDFTLSDYQMRRVRRLYEQDFNIYEKIIGKISPTNLRGQKFG